MAVLGVMGDAFSTIICNGYKDSAYVRLALMAQAMGHKVYLVIEKYSELALILHAAKQLNMQPCLGVRIRLVTKGAGKWENTGGAKSKFGLNSEQVLELVRQLKQEGMLDCLHLMHCHLGSQIANINDIRDCMQEVTQYYIALRQLGVPIATLDVGGGLAVDYEGRCSSTDCSMNYAIQEYASNILMTLMPACRAAAVPEPHLISESGRALSAHHAVLVTNITDVERPSPKQDIFAEDIQACHLIPDILDTLEMLPSQLPMATYHAAIASLEQAHAMFKHGLINLKQKAIVEAVFIEICLRLQKKLQSESSHQDELLQEINERVATKVYCNLSFFQSIPDAWAIQQIFPIAPLTQLLEQPRMQSILYDLTCDSDGTVKTYTGERQLLSTMMLPRYEAKNPYALGFFLVGAYQETLGNLHNLFGNNSSIVVKLHDQGVFEVVAMSAGDTIEQVLTSAHFKMEHLERSIEKQLKKTNLPYDVSRHYLNEMLGLLSKFTYLELEHHD
jgi:arginine decarboxylase